MQDGCKLYMDSYIASNGSCFMFTWTMFKDHFFGGRPTQNWETMALQILTIVDLFYFMMCGDQCSRLKLSLPFKCDLALQNIPFSQNNPSKRNPKLKMKTSLEVLDLICPPTRTNKRMALSLQEVELDGCFVTLQIVLKTCTIEFMHNFNASLNFIFIFLNWWLGLEPTFSTNGLKFESPS